MKNLMNTFDAPGEPKSKRFKKKSISAPMCEPPPKEDDTPPKEDDPKPSESTSKSCGSEASNQEKSNQEPSNQEQSKSRGQEEHEAWLLSWGIKPCTGRDWECPCFECEQKRYAISSSGE